MRKMSVLAAAAIAIGVTLQPALAVGLVCDRGIELIQAAATVAKNHENTKISKIKTSYIDKMSRAKTAAERDEISVYMSFAVEWQNDPGYFQERIKRTLICQPS